MWSAAKVIRFNFLRNWNYIYTKLHPDTVHKAPISFHIKIYLWLLVDYQHPQKYFYIWNITLNHYFMCKINIRGNFPYLEMPLVASITHILTPLFCPLWKIVNESKSVCRQCQWSCRSKFWSIFLDEISFSIC